MGLKNVQRIDEGPLDFARGAAGAAGQKMGNAARGVGQAVKRGVGDVVQAGRAASATADLDKAVATLAKLIVMYDELKQDGDQGQQEPEQQPAQQQPGGEQQAQGREMGGVAQAFRTTEKPRARMGKYGPEMTFNSFVQAVHGDQLNEELTEGMWDFVKGAGGEIKNKVRSKINAYANGGQSVLRDLYQAGRSASTKADFGRTKEQTLQALAAVIQQLKRAGGDPQATLQASVQRSVKDPAQASRLIKLVMSNMNKQR